jgi:protein TonB
MFDLITGKTPHMPGGGRAATLLSCVIHTGAISAIVIVPLMFVTNTLPPMPTMMAFVATASPSVPPPPPPPPPPAPRAVAAATQTTPSHVNTAPVVAPSHVEPEAPGSTTNDESRGEGVEGGVPGGVAGGIVGGVSEAPPPPPPPPPPPAAPREPVHVGGEIRPPVLLQRVEPSYPDLALRAHVEGTVILEAIIDERGAVQRVKVLRSIALLDKAAIDAVEQWRYSPVILNGTPVPVILTVVLSFKIPAV